MYATVCDGVRHLSHGVQDGVKCVILSPPCRPRVHSCRNVQHCSTPSTGTVPRIVVPHIQHRKVTPEESEDSRHPDENREESGHF